MPSPSTRASPSSASPCPKPPRRRRTTSPSCVAGTMVYVSGQISRDADGLILGKLGAGIDVAGRRRRGADLRAAR